MYFPEIEPKRTSEDFTTIRLAYEDLSEEDKESFDALLIHLSTKAEFSKVREEDYYTRLKKAHIACKYVLTRGMHSQTQITFIKFVFFTQKILPFVRKRTRLVSSKRPEGTFGHFWAQARALDLPETYKLFAMVEKMRKIKNYI